jgi:membrane-bound lytic murein transglycosylase D
MIKTRLVATCALALLCAACATAPPPKPMVAAASTLDAADFHKALDESYAAMIARDSKPAIAAAPIADVEAAVSMPIPDEHAVRSAVTLFTTDLRNDIQTYFARSTKYKRMIDKVLAEAGLPKALAYLPVIESGYSTTMTSSAGARGMWQFMSETAREYGLRVDWWVDERCDPERSTRAAAQYLQDLYRQFNDWPLALASYNGGPGRIRRALENEGVSSFWELSAIPKETRGYVPTFYATLVIASDPASYGFRLDDVSSRTTLSETKANRGTPSENDELPDFKRVELEGPLSLKYLASVANVNEDVLRDLNPAYRRGVLPPGRSTVRMPSKVADTVVARATMLKNEDSDIAVCSFTLRDGDSVKKIARALGTTPDTIAAMNDLRGTNGTGEGHTLYLPVRARDLGTLLNAEAVYYAVRKGDTLYSIARRHNLTVEELRDLNDLSAHVKLHSGQKLRVNTPRTLTASQ